MIKLIKSAFYKEDEIKEKLLAFIGSAERFSFGEECQKFEKDFAKYEGKADEVFVNSGSSVNLVSKQRYFLKRALKRQ